MSDYQVVHESETGTRLVLTSHSIDNTFDYCPRKFEFLNLYDKRPPRDSGFAASVGTALHEGVQAWLIARAEGQSKEYCIGAGYKALLVWYPWADENKQKTSTRDNHRTIAAFDEIISSHEWNDWELMRVDNGKWAVELPFLIRHTSIGEFTIKSTGERALLCTQGKIDFILRHRLTGEVRTWDLKTTTLDSNLVRAEYTYSGQQVGYSHVVHAMLGIAPDKFSVWYMIARFSASEPAEIQPIEMYKEQDMIDDYWMAKIDRLARMRSYAEHGWFPRTNGGCHSWGHECPCFDICRSRDDKLIQQWFAGIEDVQVQQGYDWWVVMDV